MPATVVVISYHRVTVRGRVAAGDEVFELALDVGEQGTRTQAEAVRAHPALPQLFLHEHQPLDRGPGGADAARGLESDRHAGLLEVVADLPDHDEADRKRGVH